MQCSVHKETVVSYYCCATLSAITEIQYKEVRYNEDLLLFQNSFAASKSKCSRSWQNGLDALRAIMNLFSYSLPHPTVKLPNELIKNLDSSCFLLHFTQPEGTQIWSLATIEINTWIRRKHSCKCFFWWSILSWQNENSTPSVCNRFFNCIKSIFKRFAQ